MKNRHIERLNPRAQFLRNLRDAKNKPLYAFSQTRGYSEKTLAEALPYLRKVLPINNPVFGPAFPREYSELCNWDSVYAVRSFENEIIYLATELKSFSQILNDFLSYEKKYNKAVLQNQLQDARSILDAIEEKFGVSLWLLENRLATTEMLEGLDAQKAFAQTLRTSERISPALQTLVYFFSLKAERTVSPERYREAVAKTLPIPPGKESTSYTYMRFIVGFYCEELAFSGDVILSFGRSASIIDRYLTFIRLAQVAIACDDANVMKRAYFRAIQIIDQNILDHRFENLALALNVSKNSRKTYYDKNEKSGSAFLSSLDNYTKGSYGEVPFQIEAVDEWEYVGMFDAYCRATVRGLEAGNISKIQEYELLSKEYISLLTKDKTAEDAADYLLKLVYVFSQAPWAAEVYAQISKEACATSHAFKPWAQLFGELNGSSFSPRLHVRVAANDQRRKGPIEALVYASLTYRFLHASASGDLSLEEFSESVPQNRMTRFKAKALANSANTQLAIDLLEHLFENGDPLDRQETALALISLHLEYHDAQNAARLASLMLTDRPQMRLAIPLGNILSAIEEADETQFPSHTIYSATCFGLYSELFGGERDDDVTIVCEELLAGQMCERPSELLHRELEVEARVLIYFLSSVCTSDRLDSHTAYSSTLEIESERIAILQWLIQLDEPNRASYANEIAQITRRQMIRKGVQTVEKSKIFVDIAGIRNSLLKDFTELYTRVVSLPRMANDLADMVLQLQREVEKHTLIKVILPNNERQAALGQLYLLVRDRFVSSNEYGLDVYLSVGIRHGTLSGQLRSVLERVKLVTHRDKVLGYAPNNYWADQLNTEGCGSGEITAVDDLLSTFSETCDTLIAGLRDNWVQIRTEDKNYDGRFDFVITNTDVRKLDKLIADDATPLEAFDIVIDQLWEKTDKSLKEIRDDLTVRYKAAFNLAIEKCINALSDMPFQAKTQKLRGALTMASTDVQNEIDNIATWFTRQSDANVPSYELAFAIDVALEMVTRCYPLHTIVLSREDVGLCILRGATLKGMVDLLFIVFDNMLKHSRKPSGEVVAKLRYGSVGPTINIDLTSTLNEPMNISRENELLDRKRRDVIDRPVSDRVRGEGGTGFYKIAKIVRVDFRSDLDLDFSYLTPTTFNFSLHLLSKALLNESTSR
jgi:hypothetical protein